MARLFDDAANDDLIVTSTPVTALPFSIAGWFRQDATPAVTICSITNNTSNTNLARIGVHSTDQFFAQLEDNGVGPVVTVTSPTTTRDQWHHGVGTFTATSVNVYLDGGNNVSGAGGTDPVGLNAIAVGVFERSSPSQWFSGDLAELAIWNTELSAADAAILALGYSPLFVKPWNLVFYAPVYGRSSPELDIIGRRNLTVSGTTVSDHPRIITPNTAQVVGFSPAAVIKIPPCGPLHSGFVDANRLTGYVDANRDSGMVDANRLTGLTCV